MWMVVFVKKSKCMVINKCLWTQLRVVRSKNYVSRNKYMFVREDFNVIQEKEMMLQNLLCNRKERGETTIFTD